MLIYLAWTLFIFESWLSCVTIRAFGLLACDLRWFIVTLMSAICHVHNNFSSKYAPVGNQVFRKQHVKPSFDFLLGLLINSTDTVCGVWYLSADKTHAKVMWEQKWLSNFLYFYLNSLWSCLQYRWWCGRSPQWLPLQWAAIWHWECAQRSNNSMPPQAYSGHCVPRLEQVSILLLLTMSRMSKLGANCKHIDWYDWAHNLCSRYSTLSGT